MKNKLIFYPRLTGLAMFFLIFIITGVFAYFIYLKAIEAVENEIKAGLLSNVAAAATVIDGDLHKSFNESTERDDPLYLGAIEPLERIRQASKNIRYIYTNILKDGEVYFVLNPSPQNDNDGDGKEDLAPALMDHYPDASKALLEALKERKCTVSQDSYSDEWGTFYSAYAPFYDENGNFAGTLGMDLDLEGFDYKLNNVRMALKRTAIVIIIVSIFSGSGLWFVLKLALYQYLVRQDQNKKYREHQKELRHTRKIRRDMIRQVKEEYDVFIDSCGKLLSEKKGEFVHLGKSLTRWLEMINTYYDLKTGCSDIELKNFNLEETLSDLKKKLKKKCNVILNYNISEIPCTVFASREIFLSLLELCVQLVYQCSTSPKEVTLSLSMKEEFINSFTTEVMLYSETFTSPVKEFSRYHSPYWDQFPVKGEAVNLYTVPLIYQHLKYFDGKIISERASGLYLELLLNKKGEI